MDPKQALHRYLQEARDGLLLKLDGLSEREARMPRTPTGTNLAGLVKHCLNVEAGYLGATFGRPMPMADLLPLEAYDRDPQIDFYLTADETVDGVIGLYREVWAHADQTIDDLPLETVGRVPWWPADRAEVDLHHIVVRVIGDVGRHAGHADILREQYDNRVGLLAEGSNLPGAGFDWRAYVDGLTALAERF